MSLLKSWILSDRYGRCQMWNDGSQKSALILKVSSKLSLFALEINDIFFSLFVFCVINKQRFPFHYVTILIME